MWKSSFCIFDWLTYRSKRVKTKMWFHIFFQHFDLQLQVTVHGPFLEWVGENITVAKLSEKKREKMKGGKKQQQSIWQIDTPVYSSQWGMEASVYNKNPQLDGGHLHTTLAHRHTHQCAHIHTNRKVVQYLLQCSFVEIWNQMIGGICWRKVEAANSWCVYVCADRFYTPPPVFFSPSFAHVHSH